MIVPRTLVAITVYIKWNLVTWEKQSTKIIDGDGTTILTPLAELSCPFSFVFFFFLSSRKRLREKNSSIDDCRNKVNVTPSLKIVKRRDRKDTIPPMMTPGVLSTPKMIGFHKQRLNRSGTHFLLIIFLVVVVVVVVVDVDAFHYGVTTVNPRRSRRSESTRLNSSH